MFPAGQMLTVNKVKSKMMKLFLLFIAVSNVYSSFDYLNNKFLQEINEILTDATLYDRGLCPTTDATAPLQVNVSMQIVNVQDISEVTMSFRVDIYLTQEWFDVRLILDDQQYKNLTDVKLHNGYFQNLWRPATFFSNVIESIGSPPPDEDSFSHKNGMGLRADGYVAYYQRLSLAARCSLELGRYPFDYQACPLVLENFDSDDSELIYKWDQIYTQTFNLPDFNLQNVSVCSGFSKYGGIMNASQLVVYFLFKRKSRFYFLELFIPAGLIVTVGYIVSITNQSSIGDVVGVILAELFLYFSYIAVMPKVSDFKAMDLYLVTCFGFVFAALIVKVHLSGDDCDAQQTVPVNLYLKPKRPFNNSVANEKMASNSTKESKFKHVSYLLKAKFANFKWHSFCLYTLYPLCFALFCFFYFLTYMYIDDDYHGKKQCTGLGKELTQVPV